MRGAQLFGYLDGSEKEPSSTIEVTQNGKTEKVTNPAHTLWAAQDQQVLGFINASLTREVLGQVATSTTAAQAWASLNSMFGSQSRARMIQLRGRLASTRKGDLSAAAYYSKMKGFADELAAAGKPLSDEDFIPYLLTGLDQDYNSFVENVSSRTDPISLGDMYAQFLAAEARIELQNSHYQSSANAAARGRGGGRGFGGRGRDGGRGDAGGRGGFGRGFAGRGDYGGSSATKPVCQLCKKTGHTVIRCWKRFDRSFTGEEKMVNNAAVGYNVDTAWYSDRRNRSYHQ